MLPEDDSLFRRHFIGAAAAAAVSVLFLASPSTGVAQQKQVWKAADVHPLGYPTVEAVVRMGTKLEKATHGRISIPMYPHMQRGGEKGMVEHAPVGPPPIARIPVRA